MENTMMSSVEMMLLDTEDCGPTYPKPQDTLHALDLDVEQFSWLQKIGSGRSMTTSLGLVNLRFAHFGGDGLQLHATLQQQPVTLWMDEQQWCQWSQPILNFPALKNVPDELHTILAQYTFARLEQSLELENVPVGTASTLAPAYIKQTFSLMIDLLQNGVGLSIGIVNAPRLWLDMLTKKICAGSPRDQDYAALSTETNPSAAVFAYYAQLHTLTFPCVAGYTCIEYEQLSQLHLGDALTLEKCCDIGSGALWIQQQNRLYAAHYQPEQDADTLPQYQVDNTVVLPESDSTSIGVVTAQIGYLTIPVDDLWRLNVGQIFNCQPHFSSSVQLFLGQNMFAEGQLLKIGESLLVQIVKLCR
jgi:type III secretion protein Q